MVGPQEPTLRFSCPARASSSWPLDATRQRDRPCTRAVYPQHLRDSSLVQTAFAPAPASKNRSTLIVAVAPNPRPTVAAIRRQKVSLNQKQSQEAEYQQATGGRIMRHRSRIASALGPLLLILAIQ